MSCLLLKLESAYYLLFFSHYHFLDFVSNVDCYSYDWGNGYFNEMFVMKIITSLTQTNPFVVGDIIISINGISTKIQTFSEQIQKIRNSVRPLLLEFIPDIHNNNNNNYNNNYVNKC